MVFLIVTHVPHIFHTNQYYGYSPYVREMNIWLKYVTEVIIVAPMESGKPNQIHLAYNHSNIAFVPIESFDIENLESTVKTVFKLPSILFKIFTACKKSHHIHLRCPGNIGLLGCLVQIVFPKTPKTAKYAGNWDPQSKKAFTYRLQQKILNNTFLTRNMKVLVYGEWTGTSKNIKPFFTASYSEKDKIHVSPRALATTIKFIFVGTLVTGKRPFYCIQLLHELLKNGLDVQLDFYGDGNQRDLIENFVIANNLHHVVQFHGNQNADTIKRAYQESHFVLLPSESEGWPKVIAEGMFWGCVPMATNVSCISDMLDNGNRGLILEFNLQNDMQNIKALIQDTNRYNAMSEKAINWSRKYTLDYFEQEIKVLLQQ